MTSPERTKFYGIIAGEECEFYTPLDGQISALVRVTQVALNEDLPVASRMDSLVLAEDIIMSLLAMDEGWKAKLARKLALGEAELAPILGEVLKQADVAPKAPTNGPVKRGRGRPRKAVA
jgi:hypothetical protein